MLLFSLSISFIVYFSRSEKTPQENTETNISNVDRAVASWIERSTRIQKRLYTRTKGPVADYLERMYLRYIDNEDQAAIDEELSALHLLRDAIYRCEDKILSFVGIMDAYSQVKEISKQVINAVNWVDELYVYTHLGMEELQQTHKDREFAYQAM